MASAGEAWTPRGRLARTRSRCAERSPNRGLLGRRHSHLGSGARKRPIIGKRRVKRFCWALCVCCGFFHGSSLQRGGCVLAPDAGEAYLRKPKARRLKPIGETCQGCPVLHGVLRPWTLRGERCPAHQNTPEGAVYCRLALMSSISSATRARATATAFSAAINSSRAAT